MHNAIIQHDHQFKPAGGSDATKDREGRFTTAGGALQSLEKLVEREKTDCFHPLIDQSNQGSFNLSLKFPNWLPHENFICNLLYYLKSCFKRPGLESIIASGDDSIAYNKHAFRLYRDQTDVFATLAAQSSTLSSSPTSLYDQPSSSSQNEDSNKRIGQKDANGDSRSSSPSKSKHLIKFNPLNDDQFKQLRQKIFLEF
ncbi:hypothetical protein KEM48_006370 [Puccinia striiformis f. sp. tritici PST-130]|nr:hypothetical protein KEM48_006370 [Puccinia striiformis f. sp. tritici PST-130]